MASEPDDNPFARNSAWPKMPQAPFKVGAIRRSTPDPAPPAPEARPATITPVFTRPVDPPPPGPQLRPQPQLDPVVQEPEPVAPEPVAPEPVAPAPGAPVTSARPPVELAELVIQPPPRVRAPAPRPSRPSRLPAVVATAVGIGGVAALVLMFVRGQDAARAPAAAPTPVAAPVPAPVTALAPASPGPPTLAARTEVASAPARAAEPIPRSPIRRLPATAAARQPAATEAAAATEEAISAPVLDLPPAAAAEPLPAYAPPPAPDPNAPVSTRRPY